MSNQSITISQLNQMIRGPSESWAVSRKLLIIMWLMNMSRSTDILLWKVTQSSTVCVCVACNRKNKPSNLLHESRDNVLMVRRKGYMFSFRFWLIRFPAFHTFPIILAVTVVEIISKDTRPLFLSFVCGSFNDDVSSSDYTMSIWLFQKSMNILCNMDLWSAMSRIHVGNDQCFGGHIASIFRTTSTLNIEAILSSEKLVNYLLNYKSSYPKESKMNIIIAVKTSNMEPTTVPGLYFMCKTRIERKLYYLDKFCVDFQPRLQLKLKKKRPLPLQCVCPSVRINNAIIVEQIFIKFEISVFIKLVDTF
jgi:hypothetical protein